MFLSMMLPSKIKPKHPVLAWVLRASNWWNEVERDGGVLISWIVVSRGRHSSSLWTGTWGVRLSAGRSGGPRWVNRSLRPPEKPLARLSSAHFPLLHEKYISVSSPKSWVIFWAKGHNHVLQLLSRPRKAGKFLKWHTSAFRRPLSWDRLCIWLERRSSVVKRSGYSYRGPGFSS